MTPPNDGTPTGSREETDQTLPDGRITTSRRGVLRTIGAACALGATGGVVSAVSADRATPVVDDPEFDRQYVPKMIRAPKAWETTRGSDDVTIGMLGTGVDYTHPDLADRFGPNKGADFVDDDNDDPHPNPPRCFVRGCTAEVHGTKAAGIAAATIDNGEGMAGISNSRLLNARSIPGDGLKVETAHANCPEKDAQTIRRRLGAGARYLVDHGADIINMSLSFYPLKDYLEDAEDGGCAGEDWDPVLDDAIEYALDNDVLVVSGSGNQGIPSADDPDKTINYPARKDGVLAVSGVGKPAFLRSAMDGSDGDWNVDPAQWETDPREWDVDLWGDSETGSRYSDAVDVAAPTDPLGPYTDRWYFPDYARKTPAISWAVPVVSGVAALALAKNPDLSAAQLRDLLRSSARDLGLAEEKQGGGLVDAANAVEMA